METFDEEQRQILEQIATGAPLSDVLVNIVRLVEKRSPGMPCSILLLDRASDTLRHGAAPNLPSEYLRAIDGSKIGATAGSCGAAAYLQRTVIVEDIDSHPNWVDYKHLALPHGLRACWSTPIFSAQHEPLGTFAMYYRKPRGPSGDDKRNVDAATHLAAIAIARERTEHARRDAERRLRESESLLRIASRVARIGAWTLDVSQQAVTWSDEAFAIHELPVGAHPSFSEMIAFYAPEGRNPLRSAIDACARSGVPFDLELPLITAQQRAIWVRVLGQVEPGAAPGRVRLQGALQDITERRKLQAELYQSQKMDAVGKLAGGIAHDFNNMLTVILSYTQLNLADLPEDNPAREAMREIRMAAERSAELTRQLLAFGRQQVLKPRVVDLNDVIAGLENMLRSLVGENIELSVRMAHELGTTRADPGQIQQALVNLVLNARDAMPAGGKLVLETANTVLDAAYVATHHDVRPGRYVMLAVTDTGTGMNAATRARIFEPFFTTKPQGHGTGLGLSMLWGFVTQSGGHVSVYSELDRGSTFKMYLPRSEEPADASVPSERPPSLQGHETILVVDDENQVRELVMAILRHGGYQVLGARNGTEALKLAEQHPGEIQLLLSDMVMPQMTGRELAARLKAKRPATRVLYLSGYTEDAVLQDGTLEPGSAFLGKPMTPDALLRKVRQLLGRPI